MSRRFQFSLRVIFAITSVVAAGCAIWINLPTAVRLAIGASAMGFLWSCIWPPDFGFSEFLGRIALGSSPRKHLIKIRGKRPGQIEPKDDL